MNFESIVFNLTTYGPGPLWLALWLAPRHRWTHRAIDLAIILFCALYAGLLLPDLGEILPLIASPTLEKITSMLASPKAVALAWAHFVIGDLWVGRWIALDSNRLQFPQWARLPMLLTTLFFGPLGFIIYLFLRWLKTRTSSWNFSQLS